MAKNLNIKYLSFNQDTTPEVIEVVNTLAELENRTTHDSARLLILEAGKAKIAQLEAEVKDKVGDSGNLGKIG